MYHSPDGQRVLLGAERRLFEKSLAMMVDLLATGDCEVGMQVFDELQRGQKLFALYRAARGLLRPDEPPPEPLDARLAGMDRALTEAAERFVGTPGAERLHISGYRSRRLEEFQVVADQVEEPGHVGRVVSLGGKEFDAGAAGPRA